MATYQQFFNAFEGNHLYHEVRTAILIASHKVMVEATATSGHAQRMAWAREASMNPDHYVSACYGLLLAAEHLDNPTQTQSDLRTVTDAVIQTRIDAMVNLLAGYTS